MEPKNTLVVFTISAVILMLIIAFELWWASLQPSPSQCALIKRKESFDPVKSNYPSKFINYFEVFHPFCMSYRPDLLQARSLTLTSEIGGNVVAQTFSVKLTHDDLNCVDDTTCNTYQYMIHVSRPTSRDDTSSVGKDDIFAFRSIEFHMYNTIDTFFIAKRDNLDNRVYFYFENGTTQTFMSFMLRRPMIFSINENTQSCMIMNGMDGRNVNPVYFDIGMGKGCTDMITKERNTVGYTLKYKVFTDLQLDMFFEKQRSLKKPSSFVSENIVGVEDTKSFKVKSFFFADPTLPYTAISTFYFVSMYFVFFPKKSNIALFTTAPLDVTVSGEGTISITYKQNTLTYTTSVDISAAWNDTDAQRVTYPIYLVFTIADGCIFGIVYRGTDQLLMFRKDNTGQTASTSFSLDEFEMIQAATKTRPNNCVKGMETSISIIPDFLKFRNTHIIEPSQQ
jgi:hypothetical protein